MDRAHGGGLVAVDASPRALGFLNPVAFHSATATTMDESDDAAVPHQNHHQHGRRRTSVEVDFFSDDRKKARVVSAEADREIKKEDLTINVRPRNGSIH